MTYQRFILIDSKYTSGVEVYDKLLDKVVIEIATNNKQINQLIGEAAMDILSGKV